MKKISLVVSYRINKIAPKNPDSTEDGVLTGDWVWSFSAPLSSPLAVAQAIERFNWEAATFSDLDYRIDIGTPGPNGRVSIVRAEDFEALPPELI